MTPSTPVWTLVIAIACSLVATGQSSENRTLIGHVTITTSKAGRTVAVLTRKDAAAKDVESLFCIDLEASAPPKIEFAGPGRIVYRLVPIAGIPPGVKITGPENIASALAVIPKQSKPWLFIEKGEKPLLGAGDPAAANAATVNVSIVRRLDWIGGDGRRRGTDVEGCLAPAG